MSVVFRRLALPVAVLFTVSCGPKASSLVSPDEDYSKRPDDVSIRVVTIEGSSRRTKIFLAIENKLAQALPLDEVDATLHDAAEVEMPLLSKPNGEVCAGCKRDVTFVFDTSAAEGGTAELKVKGLNMGPVLLTVTGKAVPTEDTDQWDFMEKAIGISVAVVVIGGLFMLCALTDADCSDIWSSAKPEEASLGCPLA